MDLRKSADKTFHSTEAVLLKVQSDILNAIDKQENVFFCLTYQQP